MVNDVFGRIGNDTATTWRRTLLHSRRFMASPLGSSHHDAAAILIGAALRNHHAVRIHVCICKESQSTANGCMALGELYVDE
jgi:hypothetical protein